MPDGINKLEENIARFEQLLQQMKDETREAHSVLKQIQKANKEAEKFLEGKVKATIQARVDEVVEVELEKLGSELRQQTNVIYNKVGKEVDRLINLSLGKAYSEKKGMEDLRPELAKKFREWVQELIRMEEEIRERRN